MRKTLAKERFVPRLPGKQQVPIRSLQNRRYGPLDNVRIRPVVAEELCDPVPDLLGARRYCWIATGEIPRDGRIDASSLLGSTQVIQEHGCAQDGCRGISHARTRDVGCRAMHRFEPVSYTHLTLPTTPYV